MNVFCTIKHFTPHSLISHLEFDFSILIFINTIIHSQFSLFTNLYEIIILILN